MGRQRPGRIIWALAAALVALGALGAWLWRGRSEWRAYRILSEYTAAASGRAAALNVTEDAATVPVPGPDGSLQARLYWPPGATRPHGIVLVHGMDPVGIAEPRLVEFAQVLAGNGFAVLTPQISSLVDFRVDGAAIAGIGASAAWLEQRLGTGPVAVLGLSFAGSLALLAAAQPAFAPHIRAVISVGGYDNLARVGRYLITGQAATPQGASVRLVPDEYGALLYVAMHAGQFFPAGDAAHVRAAVADWIAQHPQAATAALAGLPPPQQAFLQALAAGRLAAVRPRLLAALATEAPAMAALSPAGQLGGLRTPVFLLQGSSDNVIPWTELLWLRRDVPAAALRRSLLSPAMQHVNPELAAWRPELQLIFFFAAALRAAG